MVLSAARQRPDLYSGVAAFMPFVGFQPTPSEALVSTRLRRVLFAYSAADPVLPSRYLPNFLEPLAKGWARAMGFSDDDIERPTITDLADVVMEGKDRIGEDEASVSENAALKATRNSSVRQLDLRSDNGRLRRLVFDRAGHLAHP